MAWVLRKWRLQETGWEGEMVSRAKCLLCTHEDQSSGATNPGTGVAQRGRSWGLTGGDWGWRGNRELVCLHTPLDEEWIVIERCYGTKGVLVCCSLYLGTRHTHLLISFSLPCSAASSSPSLALSLGKERATHLRGRSVQRTPSWAERRRE